MAVDITLVHGYTGSNEDLLPLACQLVDGFGKESVINIALPGHGESQPPSFDERIFVDHILHSIASVESDNRKSILIGHSTGGCFLVSALLEGGISPDLLILINVPQRVDVSYLERWGNHRVGKDDVPFVEVAKMVSFINSVGSSRFAESFPVLIINGDADELVPHTDADGWKGVFLEPIRFIKIPDGEHHLLGDNSSRLALDVITRAIADVAREQIDEGSIGQLIEVEPEIREFLIQNPLARTHLFQCPSGQRVVGVEPELSPIACTEPVFANIEITTRCNLQCKYCARSISTGQGRDMPLSSFKQVLELLPHAYRITLVGLGEPLMHSEVVDFVAHASSMKRRVALVTNAMLLDRRMSNDLIQAGLDSIAFSIDEPNQEVANTVRKGSDFDRIIQNIKGFVNAAKGNPQLSKAVFSAISVENVDYLKDIIDIVADLGVHVLMLSDLNFMQNTGKSLCQNLDEKLTEQIREAISYAFSKNLPVLSVRAIEEFGLAERYHDFLLLPPSQLYTRSQSHTWCMSPWQTVPVDVCGNVSLCDCQPENIVGNLLHEPFSNIWNGEKMVAYRRQMLGCKPPEPCGICPRF